MVGCKIGNKTIPFKITQQQSDDEAIKKNHLCFLLFTHVFSFSQKENILSNVCHLQTQNDKALRHVMQKHNKSNDTHKGTLDFDF